MGEIVVTRSYWLKMASAKASDLHMLGRTPSDSRDGNGLVRASSLFPGSTALKLLKRPV